MAEVDIDPEITRRLLIEGGTLVFLNVPTGTEFGIDLNSWNVGEKFKGVKMIPPGLHYITYGAVGKLGDTAPKTGFFHYFNRGEVVVKKWDQRMEDISDEPIPDEEVERIRSNKMDLDKNLGHYPYDSWKKWISMTSHITEPVMKRLVPLSNKICAVSELVVDPPCAGEVAQTSTHDNSLVLQQEKTTLSIAEQRLPKMSQKPGTEIRFTKFPEKRYPVGSTAAQISHHHIDMSYTLEQMVTLLDNQEQLLGELQMAFVCFLVGQVYDAWEQWKQLVHLFCSCRDVILARQSLYAAFISTLYFQLGEIPSDFFVDIVTRNNFLTSTLQTFFSTLEDLEDQISPQVLERGRKFKAHLTKKFKWDFDVEPDDCAPVVVEGVDLGTMETE